MLRPLPIPTSKELTTSYDIESAVNSSAARAREREERRSQDASGDADGADAEQGQSAAPAATGAGMNSSARREFRRARNGAVPALVEAAQSEVFSSQAPVFDREIRNALMYVESPGTMIVVKDNRIHLCPGLCIVFVVSLLVFLIWLVVRAASV